jgi:hypothetical protein
MLEGGKGECVAKQNLKESVFRGMSFIEREVSALCRYYVAFS